MLVYSGEVYNFPEIRSALSARGHRFHTRSDTEVVLRAYVEWGANCVEHFNGMFVFAIWDAAREELLLARDRIGVKPLYCHPYPGGILFASEPKGIYANPLFSPTVTEDRLPILFNARRALSGETPLRDLYEVRPERDAPYARLAARYLGTRHHNVVLGTSEVLDALPAARRARDLPSLGQFGTSMYLLFKAIRQQSTVALSGEAPDEIFGGYPWYHDERLVHRDRFPWIGDAPRLADCFTEDLHRRVRPADAENDRYLALKSEVPRLAGESGLNARMREVMYYSLKGPLAYLLDRKDRKDRKDHGRGPGGTRPLPRPPTGRVCVERPLGHEERRRPLEEPAPARLRRHPPQETLDRPKSGYPGTHDPAYEAEVMRSIDKALSDPSSPLHGVFDAQRIEDLTRAGAATMTWLNASHLLLPVLEVDAGMRQYNVTLA